jgi:hypothetical protein
MGKSEKALFFRHFLFKHAANLKPTGARQEFDREQP